MGASVYAWCNACAFVARSDKNVLSGAMHCERVFVSHPLFMGLQSMGRNAYVKRRACSSSKCVRRVNGVCIFSKKSFGSKWPYLLSCSAPMASVSGKGQAPPLKERAYARRVCSSADQAAGHETSAQ